MHNHLFSQNTECLVAILEANMRYFGLEFPLMKHRVELSQNQVNFPKDVPTYFQYFARNGQHGVSPLCVEY